MSTKGNLYESIIERMFLARFRKGVTEISFSREDISVAAREMGMSLPKNLGDVLYSFRYRVELPESIQKAAGKGKTWIIRSVGRGLYRFCLVPARTFMPNRNLAETKVPDATPGIVGKYALNDEQALLAKIRYNRLIDTFLAVTCYSLQNHLRTTAPGVGQVETDELYVGVDKCGIHYAIPIQAKGAKDRLSPIQIEQDIAVCRHKYPALLCRPVGAYAMESDKIVLMEMAVCDGEVRIATEKHYRLVPPEEVTDADLDAYQRLRRE